jgi:ribulose-phosphate 3-epimerase
MQVIPTILEKSFETAEEKIKLIKDDSKWIQIDIIDNQYAAGKTFELELLTKLDFDADKTLWEMHLMVKNPVKWIEKCLFVNASRVIGQVEMMTDVFEFISEVKNAGLEAGLGIDIDSGFPEIPEETDVVLLMARKAGFGSQPFDQRIFQKIEALKNIRKERDLKFQIGIDGGVNKNNILELKKAGVELAYCGGAIFNGNVKDNLETLKKEIK